MIEAICVGTRKGYVANSIEHSCSSYAEGMDG